MPQGGEMRYFRTTQDPDAPRRRGHHPRHHHRRGRDRVARDPGADHAEREARGHRPARRRRSCTRSTTRWRPSAPAWRRWMAASPSWGRSRRSRCRNTSRSSRRKSIAAPASWTGCSTSAAPRASARRRWPSTRVVEDALFLLKHHQRFKQYVVETSLAEGLAAVHGNAEQLIQVLMALMLNALDAMEPGGRLTLRTGGNPVALGRGRGRGGGHRAGHPVVGAPADLRAVLHHQAAGARAPASASPSATASWRSTAAGSRWTAIPAAAASSGSSFPRCRPAATHEDPRRSRTTAPSAST